VAAGHDAGDGPGCRDDPGCGPGPAPCCASGRVAATEPSRIGGATGRTPLTTDVATHYGAPWQVFHVRPEPHVHGSFRPRSASSAG
jgi:hypothetical protein